MKSRAVRQLLLFVNRRNTADSLTQQGLQKRLGVFWAAHDFPEHEVVRQRQLLEWFDCHGYHLLYY